MDLLLTLSGLKPSNTRGIKGLKLIAGRTARTLANIADILGCMAGLKGGLRSPPAANTIWSRPSNY